jgi:hypothetical protein
MHTTTELELDEFPKLPEPSMVTLPSGESVYACRALVRDSWLQWRDVMPPDEEDWHGLTDDVVHAVQELARGLHHLHRNLPGYKQCNESPFTVSRWWDPTDEEGWQQGLFCLFKFEGQTAESLIAALPRKTTLKLTPRSTHWVEATVSLVH